MNMETLKKALARGIPNGIVTWLMYGLVFKMLIDKKPIKEALLDRDSIVFLIIVTIVEVILYYFTKVKKAK